jgi:putative membrane protein
MHKLVVSLAAVGVFLALPTFAQTGAGPALSPASQEFVTKAAMNDIAEIEASTLAVRMAKSDKSKVFADKMITDHTEISNELKALVSSGQVKAQLPVAMGKAQWDQVSKLQSLSGAEFTKEYNRMQVAEHKDAVSLFELYAKSGDNAPLKAFAVKYLPRLQDRLKTALELDK